MSMIQNAIKAVFEDGDEAPIEDRTEEVDLIERARGGDNDAYVRLMRAYAPLLRRAVSVYWESGEPGANNAEGLEDRISAALLGLATAIAEFDPDEHNRLAALKRVIIRTVHPVAVGNLGVDVPAMTLHRYYAAMRKADGDVVQAAIIAQKEADGISPGTFLDIHRAVQTTRYTSDSDDDADEDGVVSSMMGATPLWSGEGHDDVEDRILVAMVFARKGDENDLTEREAEVLRYRYGFERITEDHGDRAVSDAMIAAEIGSTRPTVQRDHAKALEKARARLGA